MITKSASLTFRAWWSAHAGAYASAIVALGLNIPFLLLAITRHLGGIDLTSLAGVYALCVVVGYYVLVLEIGVTLVFLLAVLSTRLASAAATVLLGIALFYLLLNGVIYSAYRFHVDAFWMQYLFGSFSGIGISARMLIIAISTLIAVVGLEWVLMHAARRVTARHRWATVVSGAALIAFAASQVLHVLAYERNDARVTQLTPRLPFYYPITSHGDAMKYAHVLPVLSEARALEDSDARTLRYPLHDIRFKIPHGGRRPNILVILLESWRFDAMNERVSPEIHRFSQRSSVFTNHFSSGNSTPGGVFSVFYGIHPTYWTAVKANSATIDNPVLIDVLRDNDYAFGIFADSHFERHKIKQAMFRGIEVRESFAGRTADAKDADLTKQLIGFIAEQDSAAHPFFGFAFYKSTHFSYYYPKEAAAFTPARKLNLALTVSSRDDREAFFNDYLNAVHYTDSLVGSVIAALDTSGVLENTIVVVTSDHGEEFDDNGADYWGHTGNFTGYQTRVPLLVYVPWRSPREVKETTAHIDIPPTLLVEGLQCAAPLAHYTNGRNLFAPLPADRPVVIASYINHAIVSGENVMVAYPMYVQKYRLWDVNAEAGALAPEVARQVMEEMSFFYRDESTAAR
jgi:membrane-anchored protein YejM (alkaline phosphatase superfamily)